MRDCWREPLSGCCTALHDGGVLGIDNPGEQDVWLGFDRNIHRMIRQVGSNKFRRVNKQNDNARAVVKKVKFPDEHMC